MTVMPNFRLSMQEAQDIATYLMSQSGPSAAPPEVSYMDDAKLAAAGRALVSRYGCADCHEIHGFENSHPSATELTTWASKPIEQLDFGVLEGKAKREGWYSSKGFVEHKLRDPAVYDQGREKAPQDRLEDARYPTGARRFARSDHFHARQPRYAIVRRFSRDSRLAPATIQPARKRIFRTAGG